MDFTLDSEQTALRDAVRGLLKGVRRRAPPRGDQGGPRASTRRCGPGWPRWACSGCPSAEDDGGMGAGPVELVDRRRGDRPRHRARAVRRVGRAGRRPGRRARHARAAQGGPRRAVRGRVGARLRALLEPDGRWDPAAGGVTESDGERSPASRSRCSTAAGPTCSWSRPPSGTGSACSSSSRGDGVERVVVHAPSTAAAPRASPSTAPRRRGSATARPTTAAALQRVIAAAKIAYCHEALGLMETALRLTTEYLTTRKQFGMTLNRFQALTFRAADMYTSLELTRSIVAWATMVIARPVVRARAGHRGRARGPSCRSARPAGTSARRRSSCTAASG